MNDGEKAIECPYSKPARMLNRHQYAMYHKGEWCRLLNSTCQEGYCYNCEVWRLRLEGDKQY